jgi:hypothetical protein
MYCGRCLCGGVEFQIDGELDPIQVCYCKQCQRAQGTALATNIPVASKMLRFIKGRELIRSFESSPGKERCFCERCGSPIYSRRVNLPDVVRIRAGLLDARLPLRLRAHYHVASKPDWWSIAGDDVPKFMDDHNLTEQRTF